MVDERVLDNRERWTELPHLYELEDLMAFCARYKKIYVYGKSIRQEQLVKYLEMCGVNVEGYVVSNEDMNDGVLHYKYYPVITRNEMLKKDDVGVILGLSERYYNRIIPKMRSAGFNRYFILTEYTKRTLANKIGVHEKEDIQIEINAVESRRPTFGIVWFQLTHHFHAGLRLQVEVLHCFSVCLPLLVAHILAGRLLCN